MSSISKETKQQSSSLAVEELCVVWFRWTYCLAHQVSLMSVQQFCYLLHQVCWKPALSQFQQEASVQLSLSPWLCGLCSVTSYSGIFQLDTQLVWAGWWVAQKEKGVLNEGLETSACGLSQWQGVWGRSFSIDLWHLENRHSSCWTVGSTCREVGLSNWGLALGAMYETLKPSQLLC